MTVAEKRAELRRRIGPLTLPINGQYPRPWMVDGDPAEAEVFIVGRNPGKMFLEEDLCKRGIRNHAQFLDALFNCGAPDNCRALYDKVTEPSRTRRNLDHFRACLERESVVKVLETNVICYATTTTSKHLRRDEHQGGESRGREVFSVVLDVIRPKALVVFGADATKDLGKALSAPGRKVKLLPPVHDPEFKLRPESAKTAWGEVNVLAIPSLAPPAWNKWSRQADAAFPVIARTVAEILRKAE